MLLQGLLRPQIALRPALSEPSNWRILITPPSLSFFAFFLWYAEVDMQTSKTEGG